MYSYYTLLEGLKEKIKRAQQNAVLAVNKELLFIYWEIGNAILIQQKQEGWGARIIDKLVFDLKSAFPDMKGFSIRNLKYMRAFAQAFPQFLNQEEDKSQPDDFQSNVIVQQLAAQLPWGHHQVLLDKTKNGSERTYYIQKAVEYGWS